MEYTIEDLNCLISRCEDEIQDRQELLDFYEQKKWDLINEANQNDLVICRAHGQPKGECC